jgi:hypothetical protein
MKQKTIKVGRELHVWASKRLYDLVHLVESIRGIFKGIRGWIQGQRGWIQRQRKV